MPPRKNLPPPPQPPMLMDKNRTEEALLPQVPSMLEVQEGDRTRGALQGWSMVPREVVEARPVLAPGGPGQVVGGIRRRGGQKRHMTQRPESARAVRALSTKWQLPHNLLAKQKLLQSISTKQKLLQVRQRRVRSGEGSAS